MDKLAIHIVESEPLIAMDLEDTVVELGHHVTGISSSYEEVMRILPEDQSDIFLIDIRLKNEKTGMDVVRELNKHGKIHLYVPRPFSSIDIFVAIHMVNV